MNKLVSNLLNYGGQWLFSSGIAVKLFLINVSYVCVVYMIDDGYYGNLMNHQ